MTHLLITETRWNTTVPVDSSDLREQFYKALVDEYQEGLYRYAFWLSRNQQQAEDVVQETFLRVWRSLDKLRDVSAVKPWLYTIVRNEHARLYRRYRPPMDNIDHHEVVDAKSEITDAISRQQLQSMIIGLEAEYREPLLLQIVGGFSVSEIADMLGLKLNTVLSRLFRARVILKQRFGCQDSSEEIG